MLILKLYGVLAPLRGGGIGTRLYTAFAATAVLTIAAGLAANLSFVRIEKNLTDMTHHGVLALEASAALEAGALRLTAIAPELRSAADPKARAGATARIDVEFDAVRGALDTLETIGRIPVAGFDQTAREMRSGLIDISRKMAEVDRMELLRLALMDKVTMAHQEPARPHGRGRGRGNPVAGAGYRTSGPGQRRRHRQAGQWRDRGGPDVAGDAVGRQYGGRRADRSDQCSGCRSDPGTGQAVRHRRPASGERAEAASPVGRPRRRRFPGECPARLWPWRGQRLRHAQERAGECCSGRGGTPGPDQPPSGYPARHGGIQRPARIPIVPDSRRCVLQSGDRQFKGDRAGRQAGRRSGRQRGRDAPVGPGTARRSQPAGGTDRHRRQRNHPRAPEGAASRLRKRRRAHGSSDAGDVRRPARLRPGTHCAGNRRAAASST